MSSKGIEPFTVKTNSFTENHHYQSDHLPLSFKVKDFKQKYEIVPLL